MPFHALLTRPARMQDLVNRHRDILNLVPMTADHIGTLADIPARPVDPVADDKTTKPTVSANANANAGTVR